jgi:beta-glucoside operon transcriptional antiterminator
MSHMRYFATRFLEDRMLTSTDDFLFGQVSRRYPHAHESAEKIRTHIAAQYGQQISNEEVAYLTLHIERLASP